MINIVYCQETFINVNILCIGRFLERMEAGISGIFCPGSYFNNLPCKSVGYFDILIK